MKSDKHSFARATPVHPSGNQPAQHATGWCNITTARRSLCNPPLLPISQDDMDRVYGLPYMRKPHPMYEGAEDSSI